MIRGCTVNLPLPSIYSLFHPAIVFEGEIQFLEDTSHLPERTVLERNLADQELASYINLWQSITAASQYLAGSQETVPREEIDQETSGQLAAGPTP